MGLLGDGVVDARHRGGDGAAEPPDGFQRHDLDFPRDAGDAAGVVADGPDDAGDMGAVADIVVGIGRKGGGPGDGGVDAVTVVDVAVGIVVDRDDPVALIGILPEVGRDVLVGKQHARIDHRDDHVGRLAHEVPRRGGADVRSRRSPALARVGQRPLVGGEPRIVGDGVGVADVVRFDELVESGRRKAVDHRFHVLGRFDLERTKSAQPGMRANQGHVLPRLCLLDDGEAGPGLGEQSAGAVTSGSLLRRYGIIVGGPEEGRGDSEGKQQPAGETEAKRAELRRGIARRLKQDHGRTATCCRRDPSCTKGRRTGIPVDPGLSG